MRKQYVAAIMKKQSLGNGDFLFYCDHVALGTFDEKTRSFVDENGEIFISMVDSRILSSENLNIYFNLIDLDDLLEKCDLKAPLPIVLEGLEGIFKETFYYFSKNSDGKYYFATFDKNEIAEASLRKMQKEQDESVENERRYADHYMINLELEQLLVEVLEEKYTVEELHDILKQLEVSLGGIGSITDAIEEQLDDIKKKNKKTGKVIKDTSSVPKEKKEETKDTSTKIDIEDLFQKVTKTLIAQDEPARRVITELARKEMDIRKKKEGILLTGPTGVGKTELMRLIAKYIDRPFLKVNSPQLTVAGYVGTDIEVILWDLYVQCGKDLEKTEKAIIFFDEIDKKGSDKKSDVNGRGVLNALLPFIEGETYDACSDMKYATQKVKISTKNMIVVLGGAFSEVYKDVNKSNFGFLAEESSHEKDKLMTTKRFVDQAMMSDEFMSRVTVIKLNELDVASIKRILLESDESAIKIQQEIFEKMGVRLTFTDGYTERVARDAYAKKTGARGLNGIIDESTWKAFGEVYSHPNMYQEVILNEDTVEDNENYQLVKKI